MVQWVQVVGWMVGVWYGMRIEGIGGTGGKEFFSGGDIIFKS